MISPENHCNRQPTGGREEYLFIQDFAPAWLSRSETGTLKGRAGASGEMADAVRRACAGNASGGVTQDDAGAIARNTCTL